METRLRELSRIIASGNAMLFTGAGFSANACDLDGNCLPDSARMCQELWPICFPDGEPDGSSLQDLYDVALLHAADRLRTYVDRRLRVGDAPLPAHIAAWLGAPWKRIYTLNVDDLEVAVQRQYKLPRRLHSISALASEPAPSAGDAGDAIDVIHLNGMAGARASELTFSTMQYAARLCARDREYERLVSDLEHAPFVFAGTTLDEAILWQHFELHRRRKQLAPLDHPPDHPPAFLISSSLTRARRMLLESLRIEWVQSTIAEVADQVLSKPAG
ncbi:MAG: hypothetical protein H0T89_10525 [Deltaproteobacteria bacterium]|nr:hypothetical protein [Deltaproteobacteria bacterium]MDQ3296242.1 hypothetical protein [Myxococcota bacterium]